MLKDMHFLLKSANLTNETIAKIIILGYNLVELSKNRIRLNEKLLVVLGKDFFLCCNFEAAAKKKDATLERDRNINPEGHHLYSSDTDIEKLYSSPPLRAGKIIQHALSEGSSFCLQTTAQGHKKVALFNSYSENNKPLSLLFLLGFILGDGNFTIRIRDTGKGL